jgi:hypothetical protein
MSLAATNALGAECSQGFNLTKGHIQYWDEAIPDPLQYLANSHFFILANKRLALKVSNGES